MGRGAISAGGAQTLGRISGLVRDVVFASVFGAVAVADAFFAAFRVPNLFREPLAAGTLSNAFVPPFAETNEQNGRIQTWAWANAVIGLLLVALSVLTAGVYWFSEPPGLLVASGFTETPGKVGLASAAMTGIVDGLNGILTDLDTIRVVVLCAAGAMAYGVCAAGLRIRSVMAMIARNKEPLP